MAKGKALFPGWYFGPGGASKLCESEGEVPKGWTDNQAEALAADAKGSKAKSGGEEKPKTETAAPAAKKPATAPTDGAQPNPLAEARNAYKALTGKGVSPRWDVDTINGKIAEFKAAQQQHDL